MTRLFILVISLLLPTAHAADKHFDISIQARKVVLEEATVQVTRGDKLVLTWTSDEAVKLHLHGYDIALDVKPNQAAVMSFQATASGRFPVTSHGFGGEHGHGHEALLYIEVYPD